MNEDDALARELVDEWYRVGGMKAELIGRVAAALSAVRADEREACALIAEEHATLASGYDQTTGEAIAAAPTPSAPTAMKQTHTAAITGTHNAVAKELTALREWRE